MVRRSLLPPWGRRNSSGLLVERRRWILDFDASGRVGATWGEGVFLAWNVQLAKAGSCHQYIEQELNFYRSFEPAL